MALYKDPKYLGQNGSDIFDGIHHPGQPAPRSGVYRCEGCAKEEASNEGQPLPPQNHHQHSQGQGSVRWRLIVFAEHTPR